MRAALREMPVPELRPGFVDRALARASERASQSASRPRRGLSARQAWWSAGIGAIAAALALVVVHPRWSERAGPVGVGLALNESREIVVVIESERDLEDATFRVYVTGGLGLAGYEDQQQLQWVATLEHGSNLLTLPVVARAPGSGQLVAEIEHQGRTKRAIVEVRITAKDRRGDAGRPLPDGAA